MAALSLAELRARLALYVAAEEKILTGQSYRIGDRQLNRADLDVVRSEIRKLSGEIQAMEAAAGMAAGTSSRRMRYVVPNW